MRYHLTEETLSTILKYDNVTALDRQELESLVAAEPGVSDHKPEQAVQIDPRDGIKILYNASRAARPHDNVVPPEAGREEEDLNAEANFVTRGKTTSVIDKAPLSEGFTFINLNLFPALFPFGAKRPVSGMHFLQWTSSYQDRDWRNMPLDDCAVVMERAAALGKTLLRDGTGFYTLFKNFGRLVGGSIAQGHQQMGYSSVIHPKAEQLKGLAEKRGYTFADYLLRDNPSSLMLKEFGKAVLLIPYCMRRPYAMMLVLKDTSKRHLHELSDEEIAAAAAGWKIGILIMRRVLGWSGKSTAYNIVAHTGPGCGIFFEFMPYTQETGGFEHLGLFICQSTPEICAENIKSDCEDYLSIV